MPREFAHRSLSAAILVASTVFASPSLALEQQVGERLFLVRDKPGTPTHFQMIVLAGCVDEANGQCRGLAHYLEHLVLVGRNPEHKDVAFRFFPDAYANGWTNQRATAYVHTVPAREAGPKADLEKLFGFYAARLRDFHISDEDAVRERNVVLQEHDWRVASSPFRRFLRRLDRALLPDHPSGQWTIGTKEDIVGFTVDDAKAFHRTWYAPNNVYFLVKGDIDAASLKEIADKALAGIAPRTFPPRAFQQQPAVTVGRTDFEERDRAVQRPAVVYKKLIRLDEGTGATRRAARQLVVSFLGSRLPGSPHAALVDTEAVAAGRVLVSIDRVAPRTLMLSISTDAAPEVAPDKLLAAVTRYVDGLATAGIPAETIDRLKARFADDRTTADQDPQRVYGRLVNWLAGRNRYEDLGLWPQAIAGVQAESVAALLRALSGPGRVVTGTLLAAQEEAQK